VTSSINVRHLVLAVALVVLPLVAAGCGEPDDRLAPGDNALRTPSGLASRMLRVGLGSRRPTPESRVVVHYEGWTTDGTIIDSSYERGEPAEFNLNGVIAGWTEGLQLMVEGEKRRFWIPGHLAYDTIEGRPEAPKGMLIFDIELLQIK
jgi:peptidylprolyl isomerase